MYPQARSAAIKLVLEWRAALLAGALKETRNSATGVQKRPFLNQTLEAVGPESTNQCILEPGNHQGKWRQLTGREGHLRSVSSSLDPRQTCLESRLEQPAHQSLDNSKGRPANGEAEAILNTLWRGIKEKDQNQTRELLNKLLEVPGAISLENLNYLLSACVQGANVLVAEGLFHLARDANVELNCKSAAQLVRTYVAAGYLNKALEYVEQAFASPPTNDTPFLTPLIVTELQRRGGSFSSRRPLPCAFLYHAMLQGCMKWKDERQMLKGIRLVLSSTDRHGVPRNQNITIRLMQLEGRHGSPTGVEQLWQNARSALEAEGRPMTAVLHSGRVQSLAKCANVADAVKALREFGRAVTAKNLDQYLDNSALDPRAGSVREPLKSTMPQPGSWETWKGLEGLERLANDDLEGLWYLSPLPKETTNETKTELRVAYNAVINAAFRQKRLKVAKDLFAELLRANLQPDMYSYNALLRALVSQGELADVIHLLHRLHGSGLRPDRHTHVALVHALAASADLAGAQALLEQVSPASVHAYNALLEACATPGEQERALSVLSKMRSAGVAPNQWTYVWLLKAMKGSLAMGFEGSAQTEAKHSQQQVLVRVRVIEEDMKRNGVKHTPATFSALLSALGHEGLISEMLERLREAAQTKGSEPLVDATMILVAMQACAKAGHAQVAFELYKNLHHFNLSADIYMFNTLIDGCAHMHKLEKAFALLDEMKEWNIAPDLVICNTMLKACVYSGKSDVGIQLLQTLKQRGVKPDVISYNTLISAAREEHRPDIVQKLLKEMLEQGIVPDETTCAEALTALTTSGHFREAASTLEELTSRRLPDEEESSSKGSLSAVHELWVKMTKGRSQGLLDGHRLRGSDRCHEINQDHIGVRNAETPLADVEQSPSAIGKVQDELHRLEEELEADERQRLEEKLQAAAVARSESGGAKAEFLEHLCRVVDEGDMKRT